MDKSIRPLGRVNKNKKTMKQMKKKPTTLKDLKKEVGGRFRKFRSDKKKAQRILASELKVHQSTITNIENGTTFPKVNYLHYFYEKYDLNLNWLVTGEENMYLESAEKKNASRIMAPHVKYGEPTYDNYQELNSLMQIPVIEQVIFAKLSECKIIFKEQVKKFLKNQEKKKREKEKKAEQARVKK
ncbi:MAG: helix-turn-helix transcriptional regulator [Candidatus Aminicenantes bacterium]|nr:MAG: helix-turn-helix transcriptional regulator [Candidatus Aminicenantes bacterium]